MDSFDRQEIGRQGELLACQFLQSKGLRLLKRNYRCLLGEIDLIMQDEEHIVFVEVRYRSRADYGSAADSINKRKMNKLIKTATLFLQQKKLLYKVHSRFDVIAIQHQGSKTQLDWIKNAFS